MDVVVEGMRLCGINLPKEGSGFGWCLSGGCHCLTFINNRAMYKHLVIWQLQLQIQCWYFAWLFWIAGPGNWRNQDILKCSCSFCFKIGWASICYHYLKFSWNINLMCANKLDFLLVFRSRFNFKRKSFRIYGDSARFSYENRESGYRFNEVLCESPMPGHELFHPCLEAWTHPSSRHI